MMPRNDDYRILNLEQQLADEKAKNGQLEHALVIERGRFDRLMAEYNRVRNGDFGKAEERIKELEAERNIFQAGNEGLKEEIKRIQSKVAKQKEALAKLNEREKQTRESIQDAREDSTREYLGRVSEMEERVKAQARVKELESELEDLRQTTAKYQPMAGILKLKEENQRLQARLRIKAETIFNLEQSLVRAWKKNLRDGGVGV